MNILRLKEYREKSNMTQRDVAKAMNISQSYYWSWENGKLLPNAKQILDLCDIFGVTPNDLFGIKGAVAVIVDPLFKDYEEQRKQLKK